MSDRRTGLAAAAKKTARKPEPEPTSTPAPTPTPATSGKKIRTTIDLTPVDHAQLRTWCSEAADKLGRPTVDKSKVWRALLHELTSDDALSERVLRHIS